MAMFRISKLKPRLNDNNGDGNGDDDDNDDDDNDDDVDVDSQGFAFGLRIADCVLEVKLTIVEVDIKGLVCSSSNVE